MDDLQVMRFLKTLYGYYPEFKTGRWATEDEANILHDLIKGKFHQVVEIGTANGWTAAWMALAGAQVYTFDIASRPKMYSHPAFPFKSIVPHIHFQNIPSPQCLNTRPCSRKLPTFWFIDGNHFTTPVLDDLNAVRSLIVPGDTIMFHDSKNHRSVANTIDRELRPLENVKITYHDTYNGMTQVDWS